MFKALFFSAICTLTICGFAYEDQEALDRIFGLNWVGAGSYQLSNSRSNLSVPENCGALLNEEARTIMQILGEQARKITVEVDLPTEEEMARDIALSEAFLLPGFDFGSIILFQYFDEGYVSFEDWDQIDPAAILASIQEEEKYVLGWIQEPTLVREADLLYCVLERLQGTERVAEILLFHFGRFGFERISASPSPHFATPLPLIELIQKIHSFELGERYADFVYGDKKADYGIAGLLLKSRRETSHPL